LDILYNTASYEYYKNSNAKDEHHHEPKLKPKN